MTDDSIIIILMLIQMIRILIEEIDIDKIDKFINDENEGNIDTSSQNQIKSNQSNSIELN